MRMIAQWLDRHHMFAGLCIYTPLLFAGMVGLLVLLMHVDDYMSAHPQITCVQPIDLNRPVVCGTIPYRP